MARLLSTPREIRDEILLFVLLERRSVPKTIEDIEQESRNSFGGCSYDARRIKYLEASGAYEASATSLLLTCKQLRAETLSNLARLPCEGACYELDVKFVKEKYIAPTWVSIPRIVPGGQIHHVRAVFQTIGVAAQEPKRERHTIWSGGDGGPAAYVWMFYDLLKHFLTYGPVGKTDGR
jgi:hypothetical protein